METTSAAIEIGRQFKASVRALQDRLDNHEINGRAYGLERSHATDKAVRALAKEYLADWNNFAIVALGGNGRQEIAPGSDIDMTLLVPEDLAENMTLVLEAQQKSLQTTGNPVENMETLEQVLQPNDWEDRAAVEEALRFANDYAAFATAIYDAGFHQAGLFPRSVQHFKEEALKDHTVWSSALTSRYIAGEQGLYDDFQQAKRELRADRERRVKFTSEKLDERVLHRKKKPGTLLEPNIKEGYGSLRDCQTVFVGAEVLWEAMSFEDLIAQGRFAADAEEDIQRVHAAYDGLLTVRAHFHSISGVKGEQVLFEHQPELATRLGYTAEGVAEHLAVTNMMREFFGNTRELAFFMNIMAARMREDIHPNRNMDKRNVSGFLVDDEHIHFAQENIKNPLDMMCLYEVSLQEGVRPHYSALLQLRRNVDQIIACRDDAEVNACFMNVLTHGAGSAEALRQMQEIGLLQRFLPPYAHVDGLMQFDLYHDFPVDEHHFVGIGHMSDLEEGVWRQKAPLATQLWQDIAAQEEEDKARSRRILYTSLFFHDIGKGYEGDHSQKGLELVQEYGPRLGLDEIEQEMVSWLVEHHLLLSMYAEKRDPDDSQTFEDFTNIVDTQQKLDLLTILTTADILSVGEGGERWDAYKAAAIQEFYVKARAYIEDQECMVKMAPELPSEYVSGETKVHVAQDLARHATALAIITPDRPGLFRDVTAALRDENLNIVEFRADTVQDSEGGPVVMERILIRNSVGDMCNDERLPKIQGVVQAAIEGEDGPDLVFDGPAEKRRTAVFPVEPRVSFDHEVSEDYTMIRIDARRGGGPGLLSWIAAVLDQHGVDVGHVRVADKGHKIEDAFFVTDRASGHKIDPARYAELESDLLEVISGEPQKRHQVVSGWESPVLDA